MSRSSAVADPPAQSRAALSVSGVFILVAHLARIALGAVYLLAALSKSAHPALFAEQIAEYALTPASWSAWQAPLFIVLEAALGVALLVNVRPRITIPAGIALMVFFIGVILLALSRGYTGECGCFGGAAGRGPTAAIVEDVLFVCAGVVAYAGMRTGGGFRRRGRANWQVAAAAAGVGLGVLAYGVGPSLPVDSLATAGRPGGRFDHVVLEEIDGDVTRGEQLLVVLDPTDPTSGALVEPSGALVGIGPRVVGVFEGTNEQMVEFLFEHAPSFDAMGHAPHAALRRFYRRLPVVLLLADGVIMEAWHGRVPTPAELQAALDPPA